MQNDYKCTKCGINATSKCVLNRSIFLDCPFAEKYIRFRCLPFSIKADDFEEMEMLIKKLANFDTDYLKTFFCQHQWQILEGQICLFDCCN